MQSPVQVVIVSCTLRHAWESSWGSFGELKEYQWCVLLGKVKSKGIWLPSQSLLQGAWSILKMVVPMALLIPCLSHHNRKDKEAMEAGSLLLLICIIRFGWLLWGGRF